MELKNITLRALIILLFIILLYYFFKNERIIPISLGNIPIISINTINSKEITSKDQYLNSTIKVLSKNEDEGLVGRIKIRGRGNSTWGFPKKPYQIKFERKEKILGMPEDKKWILLANYSDKTMLRTELAYNLGRLSYFLDWTPESRFIELFINNEYLGIYQITQKIEISSNRVSLGDYGYLIEVDQLILLDSDDVYFETNNYLFNIKDPDISSEDDKFVIIRDYIRLTEHVLLGDDFRDPHKGYSKYIDVPSFVDWYLINEITKNNDAKFYSSVYMNYVPGGKLKMGPIWDFDISLGNINYNGNEAIEGFWIKDAVWISRLFEDPIFVHRIKTRFNYFYNNKNYIMDKINSNHLAMNNELNNNFYKWKILGEYVWPNYVFYPTYEEELEYLEKWFYDRLDWLKKSINEL